MNGGKRKKRAVNGMEFQRGGGRRGGERGGEGRQGDREAGRVSIRSS